MTGWALVWLDFKGRGGLCIDAQPAGGYLTLLSVPVSVSLERRAYLAGEALSGRIEFPAKEAARVAKLEARVVGYAEVRAWDVVGDSDGAVPVPAREREEILEEPLSLRAVRGRPDGAGGHLNVFEFEHTLRDWLPASFERRKLGLRIRLVYFVKVRLRTRGRPDARRSIRFQVRRPPGVARGPPLKFASGHSGGRRPHLAIRLNSPEAVRGLRIGGIAAASGESGLRFRGLKLALVEEWEGRTRTKHSIRDVIAKARVRATEGQASEFPFFLEVPAGCVPSYEGEVCSVRHRLHVEAYVEPGRNPKAQTIIRVN